MELKKQGGARHHRAWLTIVISFCILFSFQQEDTEDIYLGRSICFKSSPIIPSLGGIKNFHTKTTCGFHPSSPVSHCFRRQQDKLKPWQRAQRDDSPLIKHECVCHSYCEQYRNFHPQSLTKPEMQETFFRRKRGLARLLRYNFQTEPDISHLQSKYFMTHMLQV